MKTPKEKALETLRQARELLLNLAADIHCDWSDWTPETETDVNELDQVNRDLQILAHERPDYATI